MIYSYLIGNFFPLFSVTAFSAVTSIFFAAVYFWWSTERRKFYVLWGVTAAGLAIITMYVAIAVAGVTHQSEHQVVVILGYLCVVMNLLLKVAPLETIKRIVRTKNASSMPVTMSIVAVANGVLWVWTSAILNDMFVLTPNAAGAALGGVQVIVYIIYRPGKVRDAPPANSPADRQSVHSESVKSIDVELCNSASEHTKSPVFIEISPSILMRRIHKQGHVGVASVIPLVSLFANSHVWLMYGYLTKNWFPIFACFIIGDIVALSYLSIYWRYTNERRYVARVFAVVFSILLILTIYVIIGVLGYTGQTRAQVGTTMGYISDVVAVCLYGAPMEKLFHVLKHKSAVFINIHMVIAGTTNNCIWFTYGVLASNWFIISPNILFMTLGTTTMILYAVYNPKTHPLGAGFDAETHDGPIEVSIELSPKAALGGKPTNTP
ncbi:hypothetical protein BBJ28_00006700, partial [Nothophytophthora sp. Chile5]